MRKWTYLVAALLMSGTAATFTSCIDNMEPTGIEAMRTAKADFYAAQAAVKQAQVAYQNALAEYQLQLVEEMKLKNAALEIANQLAAATTAKDIAALDAAKTELLAQHEVKMQQIAANKAMADAAYENALLEYEKVVSAVNGEYTAEYARLLQKIRDNNAEYNMTAARVTDLQLELAAATMNALDTASVKLSLQNSVDLYKQQLDYLEKQKDLLTTISAPDANAEANMEALDKEIREYVNDYNRKVADMKSLFERMTKETNEATALQAQYNEANKVKYSKEVVAKIAVPENIQHDFITTINDANPTTPALIKADKTLAASTKVNGADKYYLTDQNDEYVITVKELTTQATTVAGSTTQTMSNKLSTLMIGTATGGGSVSTSAPGTNSILDERNKAFRAALGLTGSETFNQEQFDHKYQELDGYKKAEELFKNAYDEDLNTYKDVLGKYKTAITNYMYNSKKTYYVYLKEKIADLSADLGSTDADTKAAAQRELLPILQKYGEYRMALDGWAHGTSATEEPLYKTIQESAITATNAGQILGDEALKTGTGKATYKDAKTYDECPYAAIKKASDEAFGAHSGTITGIDFVINIPELEDELFTLNPDLVATHGAWGGSFGKYYDQAKDVRNLEKAKSWNDLVEAVKAAQEIPNQEFITFAIEEAQQTAAVEALKITSKNTQIEINKLGYEIVNATLSSNVTNSQIPAEISVVYVDGTTPIVGSTTNNAKTNTINIVKASDDTDAGALAGTLGLYIDKIVAVHNGLANGITSYENELTKIKNDIADITKLYTNALNKQEEFENGGYTIGEANTAGAHIKSAVTITLAKDVTVTLTPISANSNPSEDNYGGIKVDINYPYTNSDGDISSPSGDSGIFTGGSSNNSFTIKYKLEWFEAVVDEAEGDAPTANLTATFLKSWIEAKNAEITYYQDKMADLKKEGEYIQKELDAFLAVINARYPAAE